LVIRLDHELTLFLDLLLGSDSLELSLLNLLNNHFVIDLLLDTVLSLDLLGTLDRLETIDFDHEILLFLFLDISLANLLLLLKLFVSDCNNLGIHNHFIHFFNVISILVSQITRLLNDLLLRFSLLFFLLREGHVLFLGLSDSQHSLLFCDSRGELFLFLLLVDSLFLELFLLRKDDGLILKNKLFLEVRFFKGGTLILWSSEAGMTTTSGWE